MMKNGSKPTHTPGPWTVFHGKQGQIEIDQDGERGAPSLASVHFPSNGLGKEINDANARLIAAAPDLLKAARSAVDWMDDGIGHKPPFLDALRAAIAKAEQGGR
jgi:hypothetical protein